MANINTLSDAVGFLRSEFTNELSIHANFQNPEVAELSEIILDIFKRLDQEINGYED